MEYSTRPWYKRWWGALAIFFFAIILFFLAASAFYFLSEIKNARSGLNKTDDLALTTSLKYDAAAGDHFWLGAANAKITIVEFGDFACPVCEKAFPTIRELSLKYKDEIKLVWRDYPVVTEYSANLALAGRCAGEQGLFWPMHDKLFQNQGVYQASQLTALANQIGADTAKFQDCLNKQKYLAPIQKDLSDGQSFSITGTPAYFINGYKVEGDIPYETFVKIIEETKK